MLTQDITSVLGRMKATEGDDLGSNSLCNSMIRQNVMSFIQNRMGNGSTCDNRLVVSKHLWF